MNRPEWGEGVIYDYIERCNMPQVHFVKKARKTNKTLGIKKGDSYYWWKFRYGGKHVSTKHPRPSQLTQSDFLGTALGLQESIDDVLLVNKTVQEDTVCVLRDVADEHGT